MKNAFLLGLFLLFICHSCEDVITIETPSEAPRLVVDGLIRVDRSEEFIPIEITVSLTNNFFEEISPTSLENIEIIAEEVENGTVVRTSSSSLAEEINGSGRYIPDPGLSTDQRIPTAILNGEVNFVLRITHQGRRYMAQTNFVPTVPIDTVVQGNGTLFNGDETEAIISFTDNPDRNDYYIFDLGFGDFLVTEDEFYQGQQFEFSWFYDQQFESGRELEISILGADEAFYSYMDQLIEQGGDSQGPFQVPAATVRGNIFDITDLDNIDAIDNVQQPNVFPLGYFAIVQEYKQTLTIE